MTAAPERTGQSGPWPATAGPLQEAIAALERGVPIKRATEQLLLALDDGPAEQVMQVLRESRGAWLPVSTISGGRALFCGNGLSGATISLARAGFEVTLCEPDARRLRFGQLRAAQLADAEVQTQVADGPRLAFDDGAFDLVILEQGFFGARIAWPFDLAECRRVCSGEVVLVADNRLGYKRSGGRHGIFHVPGPFEWLGEVLSPPNGERSLAGYRKAFRSTGLAPRSFALYPHSGEFAYVVALDTPLPGLPVGPKERENRPKVIAKRMGLFPLLTPSFAIAGRAAGSATETRLDRVLAALAEHTGEPLPEAEHMVATRGNSALVLTRGDAEPGGAGHWCLHVPFSPAQRGQVEAHFRHLGLLRDRFAGVPAPEPLFAGELDGLYVTCERRLPGLGAPQFTGDRAVAARIFAEASEHFAQLVLRPAQPFSEQDWEQLVAPKFELVREFAEVPSTLRALDELQARTRDALIGNAFPLVFHHADLRSKHVQVEGPSGRVLGYLDWGSSEEPGLPYFDLLHLIVHERKQVAQCSAGAAWHRVCDADAELHSHERLALDTYADRLGLDAAFRAAIADAYPVLVGAMAEANWDYSRPRWVHRQFGL